MKPLSTSPMPRAQIDALEAFAHTAPPELQHLLSTLAGSLRDGDEILAVGGDETLTPNQAAKELGMSRTHLYKLLDDGTIASHRVGRDRRIPVRDLLAFAARRDGDRRQLAEQFAHQDRTSAGAVEEIADLI